MLADFITLRRTQTSRQLASVARRTLLCILVFRLSKWASDDQTPAWLNARSSAQRTAMACSLQSSDFQSKGGPAIPARMNLGSATTNSICPEDVEALHLELAEDRKVRDAAFSQSGVVNILCTEATNALQYGLLDSADAAIEKIRTALGEFEAVSSHESGCRHSMMQQACESYAAVTSLRYFLESGKCMPRGRQSDLDDEEYISGLIKTCQELTHYAMRRATMLDQHSVKLCRGFVGDLKAELLGFDFRNGPLRRKFDGVKYAERRCEDLLYELSFVDGPTDVTSGTGESTVDQEEWETLRKAYADYDAARENVIKGCRDVQKAAKQAIFAAQRGDRKRSAKLIAEGNVALQQVWQEHVRDNPSLRQGSFAGALEELAEAEMFLAWLPTGAFGNEGDVSPAVGSSKYLLPLRSELASGLLTAMEFLGALSDFTGEVGRVAVQAATRRDRDTVRLCLEATFACHGLLASVPLHGKQAEKVQAAERNLWKLEAIEYDMAVRGNMKGSLATADGEEAEQAD
eukprot:TRINITY_DN72499_c0_g1_i1.p1 TRINITY_DN72499_c0_g1~~TRINITY_DN72499_c0_g1_i1.p1  ORF type:complete len:533 (-),score=102.02 TRINITY_DN72499_c0_g1_i1:50-1603(-)